MEEIKNYIGQNIDKVMDADNCKNVVVLLSDCYLLCVCHSYNKGLYKYFKVPSCLESLELDKPYSFADILKEERKYNLMCELTDLKESFELC